MGGWVVEQTRCVIYRVTGNVQYRSFYFELGVCVFVCPCLVSD